MRSRYKVICTVIFMIVLILLSGTVRSSIQNSLYLCFNLLIPSLYPFFIISGMLFDFGIDLLVPPHLYSFIIGLICGYPLGTKTVCQCYSQQYISKRQAHSLLLCTANASPAFVIIALGEGILRNKTLGFYLYLSQCISAVIIFLLCVPKEKIITSRSAASNHVLISLISNAQKAIEQILLVCAITVIFGIFSDLIRLIIPDNLDYLIGLIEILHAGPSMQNCQLWQTAMILGCSGLCIWMQCAYFVYQTDLNVIYLFLGKIHTAISLPSYIALFFINGIHIKILSVCIIILTNLLLVCIINSKGRDNKHDFFKKHRKMLCLLRTRNKNSI